MLFQDDSFRRSERSGVSEEEGDQKVDRARVRLILSIHRTRTDG